MKFTVELQHPSASEAEYMFVKSFLESCFNKGGCRIEASHKDDNKQSLVLTVYTFMGDK